MTYFLPIILAICSYVVYHISQKLLSGQFNPFWVTGVAYTIAALVAWTFFILFSPHDSENMRITWPMLMIGLSVVGLDVGFIMAYRLGWAVNIAPIFANTAVAILLIPIGILFFREKPSIATVIGLLLCISGLLLLKNK